MQGSKTTNSSRRGLVVIKSNVPSRMSTSTGLPLTTLSEDIYFEIFGLFDIEDTPDWLANRESLRNLMFVCRLFYNLASKRLLQTLHIDECRPGFANKQGLGLCRMISRQRANGPGSSVLDIVRACTLNNFHRRDPLLLATFGRAITRMRNLHKLKLSWIDIDRQLFRQLISLEGLRSLDIVGCTFSQGIRTNLVSKLRLRKFGFCASMDHTDRNLKAFYDYIGPEVEELSLSLIQFHHSEDDELISLPLHRGNHLLRHLSIDNIIDDPNVWAVLSQLRQLKSLTIFAVSPSPLPRTWEMSLPPVQSLSCDPAVMSAEPVSSLVTLKICSPYREDPAEPNIPFLQTSARNLRALIVPANVFVAFSFGDVCPGLQELTLVDSNRNRIVWDNLEHMVNDLTNKDLSSLPISKLYFDTRTFLYKPIVSFDSPKVEEQRKILPRLREVFPSVKIIGFGGRSAAEGMLVCEMYWKHRKVMDVWELSLT